jgi:PAS domain S-box-containing protein
MQAEDALRREKMMLTRTEGIAHIGSWEWDIATDTVTWSDELFRIFQRDPKEGAPSFAEHPAFYHPDDFALLRQAVEVAVASGTPYKLELRAIRKDGETRVCMARGAVETAPGGKPVGLFGSLQDITERKYAEEALKESELKFKSIVEHVSDIFFILNSNLEMVYISPQVQMLGYTSEEMLNIWQNLVTDNPIYFAAREKTQLALTTGEKQEPYLQEFMHRDGKKRLIEINESPFKNDNGEVIGIVGAARDVTERKRFETAIRESEEKYRMVVENAQEAIFIAVDGMIKFANSRAAVISGYPPEEITSKPFIDFIHLDDRQIVAERYIKWLNGEDVPTTDTVRFIFKPGNIIWGELHVVSITWEGRPAVLGFLTDVTDRKRLEEEQQRVAKLESVGLLAGGIAHDFNNILTSILGNISLASMEAAPGSELQESLEQAEKASQRAKALTVQLLTFSKGGAPVLKLASLTELLKDTAGFALSGSNVKCHFSIPPDLWHAEIDAGQVSQIIHNLVINAQQAMPAGGSIEIRAENIALSEMQSLGRGLPIKSGDYVRIAVTDHGIGIPKDHLEKIFDPFFTTKQKGNGMGLAISFSIARQHGGHISVESELGIGSTFYLYLPASTKMITREHAGKEAIKPDAKARILVMDDEKGVREIAGRMLKHIGYKDIEFAEDGAEAIKMYKAAMETGNPFTVAILDLTIAGGMGGEIAIQKLLKIDPGVTAIVSSGYIDDPVIAKYRDFGFSGMVAKPYTIAELRKAVQDVIG